MFDERTVENRVLEEYRTLVGTAHYVDYVRGYTHDNYIGTVEGNFIVQVEETDERDILCWTDDDWLNPNYNVTILYPKGVQLRSCWILGRAHNKDGRIYPGDILMEGDWE
jgi:hypothetical protein